MNRILAHFFSWLGNPLFLLTYVVLYLLWVNPNAFGLLDVQSKQSYVLIATVFVTTCLLPGLGILLLKPLGFVKHFDLRDKQERTGPYIITAVFYLWLFKNVVDRGVFPEIFSVLVLGATLGLFFDFFFNIFFKISAHATGMGGLVAALGIITLEWPQFGGGLSMFGGTLVMSPIFLLALSILLAGFVGTSRLALRAHTPYELWRGYLAGFTGVILANTIL